MDAAATNVDEGNAIAVAVEPGSSQGGHPPPPSSSEGQGPGLEKITPSPMNKDCLLDLSHNNIIVNKEEAATTPPSLVAAVTEPTTDNTTTQPFFGTVPEQVQAQNPPPQSSLSSENPTPPPTTTPTPTTTNNDLINFDLSSSNTNGGAQDEPATKKKEEEDEAQLFVFSADQNGASSEPLQNGKSESFAEQNGGSLLSDDKGNSSKDKAEEPMQNGESATHAAATALIPSLTRATPATATLIPFSPPTPAATTATTTTAAVVQTTPSIPETFASTAQTTTTPPPPSLSPESSPIAVTEEQGKKRIRQLETQLAEARLQMERLKSDQHKQTQDDTNILTEIQKKMQEQMGLKAEAENRARLAEGKLADLEKHSKDESKKLAAQLAEAKLQIKTLKANHDKKLLDDTNILTELQGKLQEQMGLKAEAENRARLAESKLADLEELGKEQAAEFEQAKELNTELDSQRLARAEAEESARLALQRMGQLEKERDEGQEHVKVLQKQIVEVREELASMEQELNKIREQRNEQERKEMSLTSRLNAAKKKEAGQVNLAEKFEEEMDAAKEEIERLSMQLKETRTAKISLERAFEEHKKTSSERINSVETAFADERRLNEDRKQKMKVFIEKKSEELRVAKADNDSVQNELTQTSRSLMDLNNRWKQLHAQWVQSQTRNRELQRDLNRIKKDSEKLHQVGDNLGMKLSRSANETEEHKNKRLAAKHELMTVLRTLETERELTSRLRDSIKFTFTPKALSQQQLLQEGLDDLEAQLQKLSHRLGKPLPPLPGSGVEGSESSFDPDADHAGVVGDDEDGNKGNRTSDAEIQRLVSRLDHETQRVSRCIMAITGGIERLQLLLNVSGDRTCFTVLSEIIGSGGASSNTAHHEEENTPMTGSAAMRSIRSPGSSQWA